MFSPAFTTITMILTGVPSIVTSSVSCGAHYAPSCADCPQGNGAAWCNGDCKWINNQCQLDAKLCGDTGPSVVSCSQCPNGEYGCNGNGDCAWMTNTNLCRDKFADDIRTASVHLIYSKPPEVSQPAWWFQRVIPKALSDATYMSSNVYDFGYGGIQQVDSNTGRVIFSLWDQGGCDQDVGNCNPEDLAKTTACGTGVTCTGFGGEGTGRKSYFDTNQIPNTDEEYFFVTQAKYLGNKRMEHTGYFYSSALGGWKLLSRIEVSTNNAGKWWISGLYSFVEQWAAIKTTEDRAALFGPSYMANSDGQNFHQIRSGWFDFGTLENHERVNAWQAGADEEYAIGIETGGNAIPIATKGEQFDYVLIDPPQKLNEFKQKIPCLNQANTKQSIESCLGSSQTPPPITPPTPSPVAPTTPVAPPTPTPVASPTSSVSCGGHYAQSCADCPQGNGAAWCNGECTWINNQCQPLVSSPTSSPCIVCDDRATPNMIKKGRTCGSRPKPIQTKCNKSFNWNQNKFCQLTCYNAGNGYDGDVCCNGNIS